jgi:hypothetical protein
VTIFEPLGEIEIPLEGRISDDQLKHYANALAAYRSGDFEAAYEGFSSLDGDAAAEKAAARARVLIAEPPAEPWDGVTTLDLK